VKQSDKGQAKGHHYPNKKCRFLRETGLTVLTGDYLLSSCSVPDLCVLLCKLVYSFITHPQETQIHVFKDVLRDVK
jgi:hypothetical protein